MSAPTEKRIPCRVQLSTCHLGYRGIVVISPRTGQAITVWSTMFPKLGRLPGRVAQAVACGNHLVEFTSKELKVLYAAACEHRVIPRDDRPTVFASAPQPLRYWGKSRSNGRPGPDRSRWCWRRSR